MSSILAEKLVVGATLQILLMSLSLVAFFIGVWSRGETSTVDANHCLSKKLQAHDKIAE
jgi:hypothetical protein